MEAATVRNSFLWAAALAAACAVLAPGVGQAAPDARAVTLVDQTGTPFRLFDLRGRPVVITFVASRCKDACPIANAEFSRLSERFRHDRTQATLVTITLDPAFDSPFVMARTAHQYAAQAPRWRFASGTVPNVRAVMAGFGVAATPDRHGVPEVHSSFVYVLDGKGHLARSLLLSSNLPDDVAALFHGAHRIR
ncbi:MAG: SCO family protein [Candidatus Eremiobacteraeota bacterium]|nr:SCO family protein [Candidatus Eremiobacteraeota bacterium]MBV9646787.1 SCO family protein [Candidatus Eremiobacteraeota bacterium]